MNVLKFTCSSWHAVKPGGLDHTEFLNSMEFLVDGSAWLVIQPYMKDKLQGHLQDNKGNTLNEICLNSSNKAYILIYVTHINNALH